MIYSKPLYNNYITIQNSFIINHDIKRFWGEMIYSKLCYNEQDRKRFRYDMIYSKLFFLTWVIRRYEIIKPV